MNVEQIGNTRDENECRERGRDARGGAVNAEWRPGIINGPVPLCDVCVYVCVYTLAHIHLGDRIMADSNYFML